MILCILPCDFCKLFVDPEKFSLRIHNGIGQRQFLDQMLLNLAVFGRKGNQLVDHLRTLSVIENCGCDHIDCKNSVNHIPAITSTKYMPIFITSIRMDKISGHRR